MGFTTFAGRVLFSTLFFCGLWIKHADEEFFLRKIEPVADFLNSYTIILGVPALIVFQPWYLLVGVNAFQGLAASLFIFGSNLGIYLLLILLLVGSPVLYDFYNHDISSPEFAEEVMQLLKNLSLVGTLLLFLGMKNDAATMKSKRKVVKMKIVEVGAISNWLMKPFRSSGKLMPQEERCHWHYPHFKLVSLLLQGYVEMMYGAVGEAWHR